MSLGLEDGSSFSENLWWSLGGLWATNHRKADDAASLLSASVNKKAHAGSDCGQFAASSLSRALSRPLA